MIPNQWYAILEAKEIPVGRPVGVTRMGEKLVLWRDEDGRVICMRDFCPHRGVALSAGQVIGDHIQCPFHGLKYDASGGCVLVPANGRDAVPPKALKVQTYPAVTAHGLVYIWWGEPQADMPPVPFFDNIDERAFSSMTIRDHWATHYSRAIENQLDAVHLPFIHRTTIGRGNRTLVNGPLALVETNCGAPLMNLWVNNEVDTGQTPLKPSEMRQPERHAFLQFLFPNLWQNWIADDMRIVIAFAPVDDENTIMYIRLYQRIVRVPLLRELFNLMGSFANLVVERQDRRVVITQTPKRSGLRIGEKLIQGDGPIVMYRRVRDELIRSGAPSQMPEEEFAI